MIDACNCLAGLLDATGNSLHSAEWSMHVLARACLAKYGSQPAIVGEVAFPTSNSIALWLNRSQSLSLISTVLFSNNLHRKNKWVKIPVTQTTHCYYNQLLMG